MKIVKVVQGTPEWHAHRATHRNASDAPAMLGVSPYKTRAQLVREYATAVAAEVDKATQQRFDDGHSYEARARPLAEQIIGEELYPCVGADGRLSASFDGLTLLNDVAFEHKSLNEALREAMVDGCCGAELPLHYQVQMEQQCMVSGCDKVLFMASVWEGDTLREERHCWYTPDADLRRRIIAGWEQFERDVEAERANPTVPPPPAPTGRTPDALPALRIEVTGMVTASNLAQFKDAAIAVFQSIKTDLQTDQDFADAERTVKWCGDIEDRLKAAKDAALAQTESIDALFRAIDSISAEARAKRLELDKLVKHRKEQIRGEIVERARTSVIEHLRAINATLRQHVIALPASLAADIGGSIKGKKTLSSITEAADNAATTAKIALSQQAERVRACIALIPTEGDEAALFPDRVTLCASKEPDDLRNLIAARIAEHQQREQARIERIRREEAERLERQAAEAANADAQQIPPTDDRASAAAAVAPTPAPPPPASKPTGAAPKPVGARIRLGEINARIAPLSITAEGLHELGFDPVAHERASKLYAEADFVEICRTLYRVLQDAVAEQQRKAA